MWNVRIWKFILLLSAVEAVGCGGPDRPKLGYVSGTITLDDEPLENVIVVMKPEVGRMAVCRTNKYGYYDIEYTHGEKGTKIGPTKVSFEWPMGYAAPHPIPVKYSAGKTEVTLDVTSGRQTFDFNLETDSPSAAAKSGEPPSKPPRVVD